MCLPRWNHQNMEYEGLNIDIRHTSLQKLPGASIFTMGNIMICEGISRGFHSHWLSYTLMK